jgi:hypothetical protein
MNVLQFHAEPIGPGLDDLVFAKSGVKPAIKNEFELVRGSFIDDFVSLLEVANF